MLRNPEFTNSMSFELNENEKDGYSINHDIDDNDQNDEKSLLERSKFECDKTRQNQDIIEISDSEDTKIGSCNLTPVILMLALSIHSLFEGIPVGLVNDVSDIWTFIIAISLHKWVAAMSLGISISKNYEGRGFLIYLLLLIFAISTPAGILIGMFVHGASEIIEIIFSSLAAGTFVYIACSEVIVEEFSSQRFRWTKFFAFVLGGALITCMNFIEA